MRSLLVGCKSIAAGDWSENRQIPLIYHPPRASTHTAWEDDLPAEDFNQDTPEFEYDQRICLTE
ncbi:MAG TPA: hypothetical protein DDW45_03300 [Gammaproteobacteria bacterium]|nr:hypothetical protein [Gammaproteobacteria bacterium]